MLTALLLLSLSQSAPPACPEVQRPELTMPAPDWAFIVPASCEHVRESSPIPWAYDVGVDPAVPVVSEELDVDIYREDEP